MPKVPPRFERGEVVWLAYPRADGTGADPHRAVIVQNTSLKTPYDEFIVAVITSKLKENPGTRPLIRANTPEGREVGLTRDSHIALDDLATVPRYVVWEHCGTCPIMADVDVALRRALRL